MLVVHQYLAWVQLTDLLIFHIPICFCYVVLFVFSVKTKKKSKRVLPEVLTILPIEQNTGKSSLPEFVTISNIYKLLLNIQIALRRKRKPYTVHWEKSLKAPSPIPGHLWSRAAISQHLIKCEIADLRPQQASMFAQELAWITSDLRASPEAGHA